MRSLGHVDSWRLLGVFCAVLTLTAILTAALPAPQGVVTDLAHILSEKGKQDATTRIRDVAEKTGAELAVATVTSLDGMSVEEYGNKLFNEWGIGKKGKDNGVLILVAPAERKIRIEVGYGLEPVLPDGLAGEVIRRDVLPQFRTESYEFGILAAVNRIAEIVEKNETVTPEQRARLSGTGPKRSPVFAIALGVLAAIGGWSAGFGLNRKMIQPIFSGMVFVAIPVFLGQTFEVGATSLAFAGVALAALALGFVLMPRRNRSKDGWTFGSASSSSSGSGSSSSSSSGGSSSGSFGGGSSGGGGASGSW
jgi:uncharacterized protein